MRNYLFGAAFVAAMASSAFAQPTASFVNSTPPPAPIQPLATSNAMLRVGTPVPVRLLEELTTKGKNLRVGHRFKLETSEPVMVQGVVVIPVGSPAVGEITDVRNKGMWGKSGHLGARLLYVTVNGRQIRLSGAFDDKGVAGGIGAVAVSAIVFLPAGFFMTGTSAKVPTGTIIKGFVDEDVPLALQSAAPPPLMVGTVPTTPSPSPAPAKADQSIAPGVSIASPGQKLK